MTVLIVHPRKASRSFIARRLSSLGVGSVIEAGTDDDVRAWAHTPVPGDIALVSTATHECEQLIGELRDHGWQRIIAVAANRDPERLRTILDAGPDGWLWPATLPATPAPRRASAVTKVTGQETLTPRQIDVVRMVAAGKDNRAIAQALGISPVSVGALLKRAGQRTGSGDRVQIALAALRLRLID